MTPNQEQATYKQTLPDLLAGGLDVVFVGINPSLYSVKQGHYFARAINRFWPCLSRSRLSAGVRQALGIERLEPMHDSILVEHGMGFTDLVKRPTARAAELSRSEMDAGAAGLVEKLERFQPRLACFQGITAYLPFHRARAFSKHKPSRGLQPHTVGRTGLFVVPSPSPANFHFTPAEQVEWYDQVADALQRAGCTRPAPGPCG